MTHARPVTDRVLLHHYPQSPVSEKVRIVLGMKGLTWGSVLIPRLPPKPNLMPLTGGYRLTPVMQIGADIYCDSTCILRELESRFPQPKLLFGPSEGLTWALGRWADGPLFHDAVSVALVEMSPNMPPEFLADRGQIYFGADFSVERIEARYRESLANVRAQFSWMDRRLGSDDYLFGAQPGLADALVYYLVWFLRDRMGEGERFLGQFENLVDWESRIRAIGHGRADDVSDLEALEIARRAEPQTPQKADPDDPEGLEPGMNVEIAPVTGGPSVRGTLQALSIDHLALARRDETVGDVCVHFPRPGYRITAA